MRFLWAFVVTTGVICIAYAQAADGTRWVVSFVGGFLTTFGLLRLTAPSVDRQEADR